MSGSKHSTYRDAKKALENEENPEIDYDKAVKKSYTIWRELKSKHYIKKKTLQLRKIKKEGKFTDQIPNNKFYRYDEMPLERIYKLERNLEGIIYPLSEIEINEIIKLLPSSMTFRLRKIKMINNDYEKKEPLPGIWRSNILGTAYIDQELIHLYGYEVRDNHTFTGSLLFYLKVVAIETLIHEIAHDFTLEYARKGRYKSAEKLDDEEYAKYVVRDFDVTKVCQFIQEKYKDEYLMFRKWMKDIGCLPLELKYFDAGLTKNPDYYLLSRFFWGVYDGKSSIKLNLFLAVELFKAKEREASREYMDYLLINYPNDPQVERVKNKLFPNMN